MRSSWVGGRRGWLIAVWLVVFAFEPASAQQFRDAEGLKVQLEKVSRLRQQGRPEQALALAQQMEGDAARLYGKNSTERALWLQQLGSLFLDLGQYDKAESLLGDGLAIGEAR